MKMGHLETDGSKSSKKITKDFGKKFSRYLFETIILSIGSWGLTFMLSVYSLTIPKIFISKNIWTSLINASVFSEYLFLPLFGYLFLHLFDITRTAVGRRTPYILFFGITTPFLLALTQKIAADKTITVIFLLIGSNLSLMLYSLAFFGLLKDKSVYPVKNLLETFSLISSFIGTISGYIYMMGSRLYKEIYTGNETPIAGFIFIISVLLVAFLIVEDKKYKVRMTKVHGNDLSFDFLDLKKTISFRNLDFTKMRYVLYASIVCTNELLITYLLKDFPLKTMASLQLVFALSTILGYCLPVCSKKVANATNLTDKFLILSLIFISLLYSIARYANLTLLFLIQLVIGFLWGVIILKEVGFIIPSRSERIRIYSKQINYGIANGIANGIAKEKSIEDEKKKLHSSLQMIFLMFLVILLMGVVTNVIGLQNAGFTHSALSVILVILIFMETKAKKEKTKKDAEVKEID